MIQMLYPVAIKLDQKFMQQNIKFLLFKKKKIAKMY